MVTGMGKREHTCRNGGWASTPRSAGLIDALGHGAHRGGVRISADEWRAMKQVYGPVPRGENNLIQQGNAVGLLRQAERDGLRIVAWLAQHVPPGSDPLKTVVQAIAAMGWDVDPADLAWAEGESSDSEEDDDDPGQ